VGVEHGGVASVSSAVVMLPVLKPAFWASSRMVGSGLSVTGSTDTALLYVFTPVDQPVPEAAESVTYSGVSAVPFCTA